MRDVTGGRVRIRLLGPVELRTADGQALAPAGSQRRAVLALLALRLGRVVPVEAFCELLWGERPPLTARAALQGHVAGLRKLLAGGPFAVHTRAPGYLLSGPPEQVDALRFETLVATAAQRSTAGTPEGDAAAIGLLEQAFALWAGTALADLPDTDPHRDAVARLDEARDAALLSWAGLHLRRGTGEAATAPLARFVRANGLREEAAALLMRCLHQAGRPSDAVAVYHRSRELLDAELGIGPGADLRTALAEILADDARRPGPTVPAPVPSGDPPASPSAGPSAAAVHGAGGGPVRAPHGAPAESLPADGPGRPAAVRPVPCLLPRRPVGFVGRAEETDRLERECGAGPDGDGLLLVVGPAGVGKSATVVRWAHRAAGAFPDGRLYADLRGSRGPAGSDGTAGGGSGAGGAADPAEVLGRFLLALGVPAAELPEGRTARAALYRSRTTALRLLVVLDDADSAEQVADLLPAGPGCAAVVTARSTLPELVVVEGAALLRLEPLPEDDAVRLLEGVLTPDRVGAEPDAAARVVRYCDRLPLALRVAASRLAVRPRWTFADLAAELADEGARLSVLEGSGAGVRSALLSSYRRLPADAAALLVALTAHPGREADVPAAAALLGTGTTAARAALGELADHQLLVETAPGRYRRPGLVRLFAAELAAGRSERRRRLDRARLLDHYLTTVRQYGAQLDPGLAPALGDPADPAPAGYPAAPGPAAALAWFRAEEPAIRALVTEAAEAAEAPDAAEPPRAAEATGAAEPPEAVTTGAVRSTPGTGDPGRAVAAGRAWRLALLAGPLYYGTVRLGAWLKCLHAGVLAAERCGHRTGTALLHVALADALTGLDRQEEAVAAAERAAAATTPADGAAHVRTLAALALATALRGRPAEARPVVAAALAGAAGDPRQLAHVRAHAAAIDLLAEDPSAALDHAREAAALLPAHRCAVVPVWAQLTEVRALQALGHRDACEPAWRRLLASCEESGLLHLHALGRQGYALHLLSLGRAVEAVAHLRAAVDLHRRFGEQAGAASAAGRILEEVLRARTGAGPAD